MLAGKTLGWASPAWFSWWLVDHRRVDIDLGERGLVIQRGTSSGPETVVWGWSSSSGLLLYAALIAGLGAWLQPEGCQQATFLVYLPMLIPLWFINAIVNQPNGPLSVILSIVPFSAPVAMIARVAQVSVPAWQMALSLILLIAAAYGDPGAARLFGPRRCFPASRSPGRGCGRRFSPVMARLTAVIVDWRRRS